MSREQLILFVKAPRPGTVKTRLAARIGAQAATLAYQTLVSTLLKGLAALPNVSLCFTPDEAEDELAAWLQPQWEAKPQGPGDLGSRMHRAFLGAFDAGAKHVLLIGSDCPGITVDDLQSAWAALEDHDVVLGPARDGGYWLIGLKQPRPELFQGVAWGTATVLAETRDIARRTGARVRLLRELWDIDTEQDWREFCNLGPALE